MLSVGVPRDVGYRALVVYAALIFSSVQFNARAASLIQEDFGLGNNNYYGVYNGWV